MMLFSCSFSDFHFSGCCNLPPKSKSLEDTTFHFGVVLMFLRDKSSFLLSKKITVDDAIPQLCPPFLKSAIENFYTSSSITRQTINGLPRIKPVMRSAGGSGFLYHHLFITLFQKTFGNILLLDLVHGYLHILRSYNDLYQCTCFVVLFLSLLHQRQHKLRNYQLHLNQIHLVMIRLIPYYSFIEYLYEKRYYVWMFYILLIFFSNKTMSFRMFFAFYVNYHDNTARQNVSIRNLLKIHFISVKLIT